MSTIHLYGYVEDQPSAEVAKRIISYVNDRSSKVVGFVDGFPKDECGCGNIKTKIPALIEMAKNGVHSFVIVDLDTTQCATRLIQSWMKIGKGKQFRLPEGFVFRVAVREIESWIIADTTALAKYLEIPVMNFSNQPDNERDPKQHLLNIIDNKGRKKWHREMLPTGHMSIGPRYNEKICDFVKKEWHPERARQNSPSLNRALRALEALYL